MECSRAISVKRRYRKCGLQWAEEKEVRTNVDVRNLAEVRNRNSQKELEGRRTVFSLWFSLLFR